MEPGEFRQKLKLLEGSLLKSHMDHMGHRKARLDTGAGDHSFSIYSTSGGDIFDDSESAGFPVFGPHARYIFTMRPLARLNSISGRSFVKFCEVLWL